MGLMRISLPPAGAEGAVEQETSGQRKVAWTEAARGGTRAEVVTGGCQSLGTIDSPTLKSIHDGPTPQGERALSHPEQGHDVRKQMSSQSRRHDEPPMITNESDILHSVESVAALI